MLRGDLSKAGSNRAHYPVSSSEVSQFTVVSHSLQRLNKTLPRHSFNRRREAPVHMSSKSYLIYYVGSSSSYYFRKEPRHRVCCPGRPIDSGGSLWNQFRNSDSRLRHRRTLDTGDELHRIRRKPHQSHRERTRLQRRGLAARTAT